MTSILNSCKVMELKRVIEIKKVAHTMLPTIALVNLIIKWDINIYHNMK